MDKFRLSLALPIFIVIVLSILCVFLWTGHYVEVVLGNLSTQHGVLGRPFDARQNESLRELVFAERSLGLHGQHAVYKHQRIAVTVVVLLIEAAKEKNGINEPKQK